MKRFVIVFLLATAAAAAQTWEAGAVAGGGFYTHRTVASGPASGQAGFGPGVALGVFLTQNLYRRVSGEIRYLYQRDPLRVESGGQRASFGGDSHAIHYDWQVHLAPSEAALRPYILGGAGFKRFRGTGTEAMRQTLGNLALLTQTTEWKPVVVAGVGLKYWISSRLDLRVEVRDYFSQFPKKVIAPAAGATLGGWIHDFVPSIGLSARF